MNRKQKIEIAARQLQIFTGNRVMVASEVEREVSRLLRLERTGELYDDEESLKLYHLLGMNHQNGVRTLGHKSYRGTRS